MISKSSMVVCFLLLNALSSQIPETGAEEPNILAVLSPNIYDLMKTDHINFLGHKCLFQIQPEIKNWKIKWDGKFWCPKLAPFSGRSLKNSRSGSAEDAIRDFAAKAIEKKILDQKKVDAWLAVYSG